MHPLPWFLLLGLAPALTAPALEWTSLVPLLETPILDTNTTLAEVQAFTESRVPPMPSPTSVAAWEATADRLRRGVLDRVVFRGRAAGWRHIRTKVVWLETLEGGPEYRIRKLRYEAVPGLWIPALLYEPIGSGGKMPVVLNVNGHEGIGKSVPYKQIRCINQAKRGMLALNPEWIGMGQLRGESYQHYRMNQLDLCGTSGLAPFYLAMARGLDVLLEHPRADRNRVAVAGLSGGGWQTIFLSALDPRVTLSNPVAGYSSFRTRARFLEDLGDSEQTPCDLGTIVDYTHLTALRAPRPTLLTFNARDNCCFGSDHALEPLWNAARPVFQLYGQEQRLRSHINSDPGDHNFGLDNRQALYRMLGDFFYNGHPGYAREEMPCDSEIKPHAQLEVTLPSPNATFNTLSLALAKGLPRDPKLPGGKNAAEKWQREKRSRLKNLSRLKEMSVTARATRTETQGDLKAVFWQLKMDDAWTVPAVELAGGAPAQTVILAADGGRRSVAREAAAWLNAGSRVLAVDPFYFGESKIPSRDFLFALLVAAVGERPLGIQAGQLAAIARWAAARGQTGPVTLAAFGPRTSTMALIAASVEPNAIGRLELHGSFGSLKEILEQNGAADQTPELFCFGLLEAFDIPQLVALVAPRPVQFVDPSPRARAELAGLKGFYECLGKTFDPAP